MMTLDPWFSKLFLVMSVVFRCTAYLLLRDASWSASGRGVIAFLCAALCGLFGYMPHIESFKASPTSIEAKMREVAEVVDEAKATLKSLHLVAAMAGATLIDMNAGMGRFGGGTTLASKDTRRARIMEALKFIDTPLAMLSEVSAADREWVKIDYVIGVFANWAADRKLSPEEQAAWDVFSKPWQGFAEWPSPDECEAFMDKLKIDNRELRELLLDYRYYMQKGEHRRPERC